MHLPPPPLLLTHTRKKYITSTPNGGHHQFNLRHRHIFLHFYLKRCNFMNKYEPTSRQLCQWCRLICNRIPSFGLSLLFDQKLADCYLGQKA